jgi:hypothetical protein
MKKQLLPFVLALSFCSLMTAFSQTQTPPQDAARAVQGEAATPDNLCPVDALNVRDFGARGDGTADDTEAFQAALSAASTRAGVVFVPAGQYRLKGSLDVPAGVTLEGTWRGPHTSHLSIGTTLLSYGGRGNENVKPFINLHAGSTLKGVTIYAILRLRHHRAWQRDLPLFTTRRLAFT